MFFAFSEASGARQGRRAPAWGLALPFGEALACLIEEHFDHSHRRRQIFVRQLVAAAAIGLSSIGLSARRRSSRCMAGACVGGARRISARWGSSYRRQALCSLRSTTRCAARALVSLSSACASRGCRVAPYWPWSVPPELNCLGGYHRSLVTGQDERVQIQRLIVREVNMDLIVHINGWPGCGKHV